MPPSTSARTTPPRVLSVDDDAITLQGKGDLVLDVLLDERRIWSFWSVRDTEPGDGDERVMAWPRPMKRFLDGHTRLMIRSHVDEDVLYDEEQHFGTSTERIAVVNNRGLELSMDKSGRMQATFDTRTADQVTPLLDSVEEVLSALKTAGVEAFPAYGTLLGAHRDGALIGHDSDADLGYISQFTHPADVARESFQLQRRLAGMGYPVSRYSGAGFQVQVTESDGSLRGLDVFGGYFDDEQLILLGEVRTPFERDWIFPLGTTTLEGRTLPAPAQPDRLLAAMYGESWRTPDPAFKFETPDSTTRRLNDWFRGTTVNRSTNDRRNQKVRDERPYPKPDPLARMLVRREGAGELRRLRLVGRLASSTSGADAAATHGGWRDAVSPRSGSTTARADSSSSSARRPSARTSRWSSPPSTCSSCARPSPRAPGSVRTRERRS